MKAHSAIQQSKTHNLNIVLRHLWTQARRSCTTPFKGATDIPKFAVIKAAPLCFCYMTSSTGHPVLGPGIIRTKKDTISILVSQLADWRLQLPIDDSHIEGIRYLIIWFLADKISTKQHFNLNILDKSSKYCLLPIMTHSLNDWFQS